MNAHVDPNAAHAVYAPSSAHRWTVCTASAEAIASLGEQEEGAEAAEGTRAHDEIERILGPLGDDKGGVIGEPDPDHPAAFGVALFTSFVRKLPAGRFWIEQRVRLTDRIWGRLDCGHWHAGSATVTIIDYKNGQRAVDVEENEQFRIYAAALILQHKLPAKWIRYVCVQPNDWRPYVPRVKQWIEPVNDLQAWAEKTALIPSGALQFVAGEQCRDCPLFGKCNASLDMLANFGAVIAGLVQPENVRPEQVALFMALEKPITDQIKRFKQHWETQVLKSEVPVPGMKLVTTRPHRAWLQDNWAREFVFNKFGLDALEPPTPAQVEKLGATKAEIEGLVHTPEGGPVLAFANDKRKPWTPKTATEMFAGIPGLAK